tara:strand:+ start:191 stop:1036 length:846 start_codon:yes stop_codon:yes gene_type:complete
MVDVLLAIYNGEKYLNEQIDSFLAQTCQDFRVLIRDDGSTDNSISIVNSYKNKFPDKFVLLQDNLGNINSPLNFMELIKYSSSNYVMLCDQDDVWLPTKIEDTFNELIKHEKSYPKDYPLLVFTDLKVVDQNLNQIYTSMMDKQRMNPFYLTKNNYRLIAQNPVAGCTMILNNSAKNLILKYPVPIPQINIVHDHWFSIIISKFGKVFYLNKQTILYRQHGTNTVGINAINMKYIIKKLFTIFKTIEFDFKILKSLPFKISYLKYIYVKILVNIKRLRRHV